MSKIILCVDMDAFFASVEQKDNPLLRGKPIAVTGAGERTVITTSSYEARAYGVKTGMTPAKAKKLCPHIIFVVGNFTKYGEVCARLEEICERFTPDVETYSIDEMFLDITKSHHLFGGPIELARTIKKTVKQELGITCTIGIGPNVPIAKLASDIAKPDGLRWIDTEEVPSVLDTLPVRKLWGIGSHTEEKLSLMGITTCGELGAHPLSLLTKRFGVLGAHLKALGQGILERPIEATTPDPKSIGHSRTFSHDIWKRQDIEREILRLSEMVGRRARKYGFQGRKITLTIRYNDFKTFSKQTTLSDHTNDTRTIYKAALSILDNVRLRTSVRLLGVTLSSFGSTIQSSLFGESNSKHREDLLHAMDTVNEKFGDRKITWASTATEEETHGVISPSWRPSGVRKSDT
ncbi:MAG TPA: DNA polymerase IV [Syntrophorhabdaceae bacterium]|nr:DNA polymerase IV [Syntrophorhabdaceae bacterium]